MPDPDAHLSEQQLAGVTALADGSLDPARADAARAAIDADPALAAEYDRQRRAVSLVRTAVADAQAPLALRERIEAERARAPASRRRWWLPAAAAAALGAVAAALVLALGAGAPAVTDTLRAASQPAAVGVSVDGTTPQLLSVARDGVPFPNFAATFGREATGARTDEIGGRQTTTVFYEQDGREVAYTIVGGGALDVPEGETRTVDGREFTVLEADGRTLVTWERGGHTCVLSGEGATPDELVELAGWKGKGNVPF
jgi:anti-sigma factor RsiW